VNAVSDGDESGQILAAYIAKEHLRALLALARRRPDPGHDQQRQVLLRRLVRPVRQTSPKS